MMCYLDRTFCTFYTDCAKKDCSRALTPEVTQRAIEWWGSDEAPICTFVDIPDCHRTESDPKSRRDYENKNN